MRLDERRLLEAEPLRNASSAFGGICAGDFARRRSQLCNRSCSFFSNVRRQSAASRMHEQLGGI